MAQLLLPVSAEQLRHPRHLLQRLKYCSAHLLSSLWQDAGTSLQYVHRYMPVLAARADVSHLRRGGEGKAAALSGAEGSAA